jgi:hypothetical protein
MFIIFIREEIFSVWRNIGQHTPHYRMPPTSLRQQLLRQGYIDLDLRMEVLAQVEVR